ncbi:methyltransferase family protein [Purpureocillium lavendulum]|uniref:Methyltransferase family protein n=1 Tax=Purpureocillium lavendulum TaxID=1247861 RepID=A0AB34FR54_9HYPO|nr:methyltransferase family protein [Purpureocillium lavendulum]
MSVATLEKPSSVGAAQSLPSSHFSGTEGSYMLPHHVQEIERLGRQHHFMKTTTDGKQLVTPNIQQLKSLTVLDSGAADGLWLRDLRNQLPGHRLDLFGVDIGSTLFPPREATTGAVVDLRSHDIRTPFPPNWAWGSKFDVIHQRLLIWGIKSDEWPVVISNLVAALKPGGYIQLVEAEWIDPNNPADPVSRPQLRKQAALQEWSTASFGMDIHIAYKLAGLLREAGLEDVETVQYDHGYGALAKVDHQRDVSAELWVECFRTLDQKIPEGGIPGVARNAEEFHKFLDALEVEIKTYGYQPKLNFVYGRKPLAP